MPAFIASWKILDELCSALGLPQKGIDRVVIDVRANSVVRILTSEIATREQSEAPRSFAKRIRPGESPYVQHLPVRRIDAAISDEVLTVTADGAERPGLDDSSL